ncbi:hypothetical protein ALI144C_05095 [Actinosynnema sp. ALI-1.44]|uniref:pPIWI_RE_Z domain-containing protein n=1 Tax=Actinosynnema sp. ALI-1.44 TaxID=1933779 RepID=UPI00097BE098|nr:hypothetical protein [Actinosynnema sp. ALI-1.44]ONI89321.1 hypothetical protein ALI144C_05095 [Actinosynnema sp. ALI-1.44]
MRSGRSILKPLIRQLREKGGLRLKDAERLCEVELGLYLLSKIAPAEPAVSAWTLFSGYPYASTRGLTAVPGAAEAVRSGRFTLWTLSRRSSWLEAMQHYRNLNTSVRAFSIPSNDGTATVRPTTGIGDDRWDIYDALLGNAPPFEGEPPTFATEGVHRFPVGRSNRKVVLPHMSAFDLPIGHDLHRKQVNGGKPIEILWEDLEATAETMDDLEEILIADESKRGRWVERLGEVELFLPSGKSFRKRRPHQKFTIDRLQHLLGIVGAGKGTLRDILTVHLVNLGMRVTVVVGDVAEVLKLVRLYKLHTDDSAAPVLGANGKDRHARRLHRRSTGRGKQNLLAHDDQGFEYLSTSCALNALLDDDEEPLAFNQAPCTQLQAKGKTDEDASHTTWLRGKRVCPCWVRCPRHRSSHELVEAAAWVATPAGLVDARVPWPQNGERVRYLEVACRRSDLVIVDEADRVQMNLDALFAPAAPLIGVGDSRSLWDDLMKHKTNQLQEGERMQLSNSDVEKWTAAVNTITTATDRLYAMLVGSEELREWVRVGYFSSWTLQLRLIEERYPAMARVAGNPVDHLTRLLDELRDNPFGDRRRAEVPRLVALIAELLHTQDEAYTREKMRDETVRIFDLAPEVERRRRLDAARRQQSARRGKQKRSKQPPDAETWMKLMAERFEFTLLLCALEPKLALMNAMWPRVESVLKLDFNEMYQRPRDYGPIVPESPMGNLLGFQFIPHGCADEGVQSGELRYFRCSGVGRELLRRIPEIPEADGHPPTNLLLMSGSSWAGSSSRYHIQVPVGMIIKPPPAKVRAVVRGTRMRVELLKDNNGVPLKVSGAGVLQRPEILRRMAVKLGEEDHGGSRLQRELRSLPENRRRILLLVGSYEEAALVADTLHTLAPRWRGQVARLVSDDYETADHPEGDDSHAPILRRGDVDTLFETPAQILVAPLLAVERGHNILNEDQVAAIGTVYFLARPNPRPDDLMLAVHTVNDWILRFVAEPTGFAEVLRNATSLAEGAAEVRALGRKEWYKALARPLAWSRLGTRLDPVTWDLLVLIWQVIGRLVRGGVPAKVVFVDAAFVPMHAEKQTAKETRETSLLVNIHHVLDQYLRPGSTHCADERFIVKALYQPLWAALGACLGSLTD